MTMHDLRYLPLALLLALGLVGCPVDDDDSAADDDDTVADDDDTVADDDDTTDDDDSSADDDDATTGFVFNESAFGDYTRVDRAGMPAVATALIASENKDAYNAASLADDVAGMFVPDIVASLAFLHTALDDDLTGLGLTPCTETGDGTGSCTAQGAPAIIPDGITIATVDAEGDPLPAGFPNGRRLQDPVIDVTLALVLLDLSVHGADTLIGTNPTANDVEFQTEFPYLADPHAE